jgi:DNA-binding transcriptional LysR family regulator
MKTELELRHLRVFATVVEFGAHAPAARALDISPSTVSETLSALERALGTPLFQKTIKGSRLTPAGEALLPHAKKILGMTTDLLTDVARASTNVKATLVVAAVESISTYVLPSRLGALRGRWPNARMEVITAVCADIRASVAAGKSDLGLVLEAETSVDEPSILAKTRLMIVASPGHPLAGRTASPDQLRQYDFYMSDPAGDYHQVLRQYFETAQSQLPRMQALGTIEGVKQGILTGGTALGLLPAHALERELREGELREVNVKPVLRGLVLRAVLSPGSSHSPIADDLIQSLRGATLGFAGSIT